MNTVRVSRGPAFMRTHPLTSGPLLTLTILSLTLFSSCARQHAPDQKNMRQNFWRIFCGAYFSGAYCVPGACCSLTVHPLKLSEVRLERSPILSGNDLRREKLMVSEHSVLIFPIHNGSEERFPRIERSFSSLNSCISSGTSNCCGCGEVKGDGGGY